MVSIDLTLFETLQKKLNHHFKNRQLLEEALTHPSVDDYDARHVGYERLEFLGDRVLGLVAAQILLERYPNETEGDIAKRHTAIVQKAALVYVAEKLSLGQCLVLSSGEHQTGGREKQTILADATEALIAALYLDGGFETANGFIRQYWGELVESHAQPPQDPKTQLQEWAQARQLPLPKYNVIKQTGSQHEPEFFVEVCVEGLEETVGIASSKRKAEKSAALKILSMIQESEN